jgi:hypothetical protein
MNKVESDFSGLQIPFWGICKVNMVRNIKNTHWKTVLFSGTEIVEVSHISDTEVDFKTITWVNSWNTFQLSIEDFSRFFEQIEWPKEEGTNPWSNMTNGARLGAAEVLQMQRDSKNW